MKDLPIHDLKFDGFITLNGQYCYNDKGVIYDSPIHKSDIENIIHETVSYTHLNVSSV